MKIPIEQIAVVERRRKDLGKLDDLIASIKIHGQITAGVVRPARLDDQIRGVDPLATPWVLVAGGRRYAAISMAGIDTYLAENLGDLPPLKQKELELEENLQRKDLNWDEEVLLKEEIHQLKLQQAAAEGETWTQGDTAKVLGETQANTSRDLKLAVAIRENPALRRAGSKISAVRQLDYERNVSERTARVDQTNLHKVKSKLVTADMRDFIRTIPENSIALTFTDFPFGIDYNFATDRGKYLDEDSPENLKDLLTDIIPQMMRVTAKDGWLALMMGSTNYEYLKDLVQSCCAVHYEYFKSGDRYCQKGIKENPSDPGCRRVYAEDPEWIWYRPNSRNPSMWPTLHAQNQYEKLCVVNMGEAVLIKRDRGNVLVHDAVYEDRIHEMQRPHSLCIDVIERLTVGGEIVADFCFGSGSALAAAAELERHFIGCDLNPKNLEPALMWVAEHYKAPLWDRDNPEWLERR
jgi:ParB-like chromosome segregation protein Spo0J